MSNPNINLGENLESNNSDKNTKTGWEEVAELADRMKGPADVRSESVDTSISERNPTFSLSEDARTSTDLNPELGQNPESEKLRQMHLSWGDLAAAKDAGIFGEKTEMNEYDYSVLAQSMTWTEFAKLADQAELIGTKSYDEYQNFLQQEGDKLYKENDLADWRNLGLAVRRYNTAKHYGNVGLDAKWRSTMSISNTTLSLSGSRISQMGGGPLRVKLEEDNELSDLMNAQTNSGEVNWIFDRELMDDDAFDPVGDDIFMRAAPSTEVAGIVTENIAGLKIIDDFLSRSGRKPDFPILTKNEWRHGEADADEYNRGVDEMIRNAITNVNKTKVQSYVGEYTQKINTKQLNELVAMMKEDRMAGAQAASDYFAKVLELDMTPKVKLLTKEDKIKGESPFAEPVGTQSGTVGSTTVKVDPKILKRRPKEALEIIAHEVMHTKQKLQVYKWEKGELSEPDEIERAELYYFCFSNYETTNKSHRLYRHQLAEEEAFTFGGAVTRKMKHSNRFRGLLRSRK